MVYGHHRVMFNAWGIADKTKEVDVWIFLKYVELIIGSCSDCSGISTEL